MSSKAFNEWRESKRYFRLSDPYYFCLEGCLKKLIREIKKSYGADDEIAIYVDQDKGRERLGRDLAKWQESKLRQDPGFHVNPNRNITVEYASAYDKRPLQAADILAHALFQKAKRFLEFGEYVDPPFLAALDADKIPIAAEFLESKEILEIVERSRLYADEK